MRLDRLASIHLFHPLSQQARGLRAGRVPILMYHAVHDDVSRSSPYYETSTSPAVFASHMKYLSENGYLTTTLDRAVTGFGKPLGTQRPVVLTFDDGFRNFYTTAAPIMQQFGFTATVFLIAGSTGEPRHRFRGVECMTWGEVREMQACGMSIGSHTKTHPVLATMGRGAIDEEVARSKQMIEDGVGAPVTSFSYPFAFPEADRGLVAYLEDALQRYGYQNGVSTIVGTAGPSDSRYFLPRLPINTWDDAGLFQAKLEGGYDWIHVPQSIHKTVRRRVVRGLTLRKRAVAGQITSSSEPS